MNVKRPGYRVAIGGLGAIGLKVARRLDEGIPGLDLVAVSARDHGSSGSSGVPSAR